MTVNEDVDIRQTAEAGEPTVPVEDECDEVEQLFEMMLETDVPTPEEAGYGHGV
jgi:hypothetical protein